MARRTCRARSPQPRLRALGQHSPRPLPAAVARAPACAANQRAPPRPSQDVRPRRSASCTLACGLGARLFVVRGAREARWEPRWPARGTPGTGVRRGEEGRSAAAGVPRVGDRLARVARLLRGARLASWQLRFPPDA